MYNWVHVKYDSQKQECVVQCEGVAMWLALDKKWGEGGAALWLGWLPGSIL